MEYVVINKPNHVEIIVNNNIIFIYDFSDDYIVFRQALEVKGVKLFAELLAADPSTAFTIFCNGL